MTKNWQEHIDKQYGCKTNAAPSDSPPSKNDTSRQLVYFWCLVRCLTGESRGLKGKGTDFIVMKVISAHKPAI